MAEAGASVAISSPHEDELKSAAAEIGRESHAKVVPLAADMTYRGEVKRLAAQAIAALGKVDIVINNAGGNMPQPIDQITDEVWDHFVELNLSSCMALTREPVPQVKDRKWGRVIHISSIDPRAQRFSGSSKRPLARRLEGCVQGFRRRRGPGAICQLIVFSWLYPSEALVVATVLAILPNLVVRGPVNRIASFRTKDSNWP